ncbi:5-formyltetrahydrofolate cyclo-ligase [Devosia chinhatensis]|uniref:5-formyltetrahydrofolate cyclo-ligase n=1 Tax=Devosia chinhatensis TaxID=429727 RepID=A0A0F5FLB7_9HYPH|nr:5-formyltetrahydrofolate cyclo-ligase [Devosia chinhatensis]KKB09636.1 5-formyltetrahydrofolate cyclo-ligase [Devosia chinhatensis]
MPEPGRWAGRNPAKDIIRHDIWAQLEAEGINVGPAWSMIPNFAGADLAAWHLAQTPQWKAAKTGKTNPDHAQTPIRIRALYEGKIVYTPVPYLTKDFPYLKLDPVRLQASGISFELAATPQGFLEHGEKLEFEQVQRLDFCVVGSVAVSRAGGRTGKGAGFADLETAIFRELGVVDAQTPMATTVHSLQLVKDRHIVIEPHDSPLDFVATQSELIVTGNAMPRPMGVDWSKVRLDQFDTIPFLARLRDRMLARRAG